MAMRCAFMTDEYTHPDVADYTEELQMQTGIHILGNMYMKVEQACLHTFIMQTVYYTRMKQDTWRIRSKFIVEN